MVIDVLDIYVRIWRQLRYDAASDQTVEQVEALAVGVGTIEQG